MVAIKWCRIHGNCNRADKDWQFVPEEMRVQARVNMVVAIRKVTRARKCLEECCHRSITVVAVQPSVGRNLEQPDDVGMKWSWFRRIWSKQV